MHFFKTLTELYNLQLVEKQDLVQKNAHYPQLLRRHEFSCTLTRSSDEILVVLSLRTIDKKLQSQFF
jgi:hypothetical protein